MKRRTERGGIFFRLIALLFFLAFLAFLYILRYPLMRMAGQLWVVNEPPVQSDVILVLGDDNYAGDRAAHAAELYREGLAPRVVASGRMLRPDFSVAELIARDLERDGVPQASIVKFSNRADNTREEAEAFAGIMAGRGWKRVLVVTSNYHTRRARFIYSRVLPAGTMFRVSAAPDSEFDPSRWWETRLGQKIFFNELVGYLVARWELRNKAPAAMIFFSRQGPNYLVVEPVPGASRIRLETGRVYTNCAPYYSPKPTVLPGCFFFGSAMWLRSFG